MTESPNAAVAEGRGTSRGRISRIVAGALVAVAIVVAAAWFYAWQAEAERTEDAYVDGNAVLVTAQVGGTVTGIDADNTDQIGAGQLLVTLNPADREVEFERAQAALAKATRMVRSQYSQVQQSMAEVDARRNEVQKAQRDLTRRESLAASGAVSREEVSHAQEALTNAQAALAAAGQALQQHRALTDDTTLRNHPDVVGAASNLRDAYLAKVRTHILAPVGGTVTRRSVQLGQRINPGAALMTVVPLDALWVNANFKESQLAHLHQGQAALLTADVYGRAVTYHGTVLGLDAGTGSAFAVLPAQNATGNWIKVTQRVPVRIALDAAEVRQNPLRIGLSMHVRVDTHSTPAAVTPVTPEPGARTAVFEAELQGADEIVERVIRGNAGVAVAAR